MALVIETRFESAATEADKVAYVGSRVEAGETVTESDARKRDWRKIPETDSDICWYGKTYAVDVHEFPTSHRPVICGFAMARGYHIEADGRREYLTTEPSEVSTRHHIAV